MARAKKFMVGTWGPGEKPFEGYSGSVRRGWRAQTAMHTHVHVHTHSLSSGFPEVFAHTWIKYFSCQTEPTEEKWINGVGESRALAGDLAEGCSSMNEFTAFTRTLPSSKAGERLNKTQGYQWRGSRKTNKEPGFSCSSWASPTWGERLLPPPTLELQGEGKDGSISHPTCSGHLALWEPSSALKGNA